jgi:hypothetical protein
MLYRIIFPGSIFLLLFYNFISDPELCMKMQGIVGKTGESPALSRNCKNEWSGCSLFTGEPDYKDFKPGRWRITMHIRPAMYRTGIGIWFHLYQDDFVPIPILFASQAFSGTRIMKNRWASCCGEGGINQMDLFSIKRRVYPIVSSP